MELVEGLGVSADISSFFIMEEMVTIRLVKCACANSQQHVESHIRRRVSLSPAQTRRGWLRIAQKKTKSLLQEESLAQATSTDSRPRLLTSGGIRYSQGERGGEKKVDYPSIRSTFRVRGEGKRTWIIPLLGVQSGREGREKEGGLCLLEYSQGKRGGKKDVDYPS